MSAMMMKSSSLAGKVATRRSVPAKAAGNWNPGSDAPAWLKADIPGNFGFDPCGLAKEPESLKKFQEAEVIHCRWAMLGAAGVLAVELAGQGNWFDAPIAALEGKPSTYMGMELPFDLTQLAAIEVAMFAIAETARLENTGDKIYPGGAFDPMGMGKGSNLEEMKLKEIKNGRLAMVAMVGFFAQHAATAKSPLEALGEHLGNPWGANFGSNGISIPF